MARQQKGKRSTRDAATSRFVQAGQTSGLRRSPRKHSCSVLKDAATSYLDHSKNYGFNTKLERRERANIRASRIKKEGTTPAQAVSASKSARASTKRAKEMIVTHSWREYHPSPDGLVHTSHHQELRIETANGPHVGRKVVFEDLVPEEARLVLHVVN